MKLFQCPQCDHLMFFENHRCEACGAEVGYDADLAQFLVVSDGLASNGLPVCDNRQHGVCNWLADSGEQFCAACNLNRYVPDLNDPEAMTQWRELEVAKHRLVYSLKRLGLPIDNKLATDDGLAFDFIDPNEDVPEDAHSMTGHAEGLVTINVDEADSVEREQARQQMGEPYRTLIGHFRHEIGHYYWELLVLNSPEQLQQFRNVFGDDRIDYQQALQTHYEQGAPADWQQHFVSSYASCHPWEDWAETWAHYFHVMDSVETAYALGLSIHPQPASSGLNTSADLDPFAQQDFSAILDRFVPISIAINSLNRSMGQPDLYPFVLSDAVKSKMTVIHQMLYYWRQQQGQLPNR